MPDAPGEMSTKMSLREWLVWVVIIFCMSYISVFGTHHEIVDRRADSAGDIIRMHEEVISGNAKSPIQYRIGSYWLAEKTKSFYGGSLLRTYQNHRFIFTFLSGMLLIILVRRFFKPGWAFAGMAYFFALLPWAYLGYHHQPADPINLFFFLLAYMAITAGRPWWIIPIVAIGMLNRETIILIPIFDLILNYDKRPIGGHLIRIIAGIIIGLAVYAAIYGHFGAKEHTDEPLIMIAKNLNDPAIVFSFGVFLLIPMILSFAGWRNLTTFMRRGLIFSCFFILFYFIFGLFHEMRLLIPILPLIILTTLHSIKGWFEFSNE